MDDHIEPNYDSNYSKFVSTYHYKELTDKYSLSEWGIWNVYGEDPNCDLGGSHVNPYLGALEGKLVEVIREAVNLDGFWHWGAGGKIEKVVPKAAGAKIVGKAGRKIGSTREYTAPEELLSLIKQRTEEGKIIWTGARRYASKLEGSVPGTDMRIVIEHHSDQREGDWYTMQVTANGNTVSIDDAEEIEALYDFITEKPEQDALADAREILESL